MTQYLGFIILELLLSKISRLVTETDLLCSTVSDCPMPQENDINLPTPSDNILSDRSINASLSLAGNVSSGAALTIILLSNSISNTSEVIVPKSV